MAKFKAKNGKSRRTWVDSRPSKFDGRGTEHAMALLWANPDNVESWLTRLERRTAIASAHWLTKLATH
jgi:hypothetical protein